MFEIKSVALNQASSRLIDEELLDQTECPSKGDADIGVFYANMNEIEPPNNNGLVDDGPRLHVKSCDREALNHAIKAIGENYAPVWLEYIRDAKSGSYKLRLVDGAGRFLQMQALGRQKILARMVPENEAKATYLKFSANFSATAPNASERVLAMGKLAEAHAQLTGTAGAGKNGGRGNKGAASILADDFGQTKKSWNEGLRIYQVISVDGLRKLAPTNANVMTVLRKITSIKDPDKRRAIIQWFADHPEEKSLAKALEALDLNPETNAAPSNSNDDMPNGIHSTEAEQRVQLDHAWNSASGKVRTDWMKDNHLVTVDLELSASSKPCGEGVSDE